MSGFRDRASNDAQRQISASALSTLPDVTFPPFGGVSGLWIGSWRSIAAALEVPFVACLVLVLGVFALRLPTLNFDILNDDEFVYHLVGAAWLNGTLPHLGLIDNKPLGLYLIHAIAQVVFHDPVIGARLFGAMATLLSSWLLMNIARRFLGLGQVTAVMSGLVFAVYSAVLGGDASQGPVFYTPLVVGGAFLVMCEIEGLFRRAEVSVFRLGWAGLLLGCSLQVKYVTVFECAAFGMMFLWAGWRAGGLPSSKIRTAVLCGAAALIAGGLLPTLVAYGAYALNGHGEEFLYYTFTSNFIRHASKDPLLIVGIRLGLTLLWVSPLIFLSLRHLWKRTRPISEHAPRLGWANVFVVVWFVAAALGGIAQMQFYDHYFYGTLPPLALMAAAALRPASRMWRARNAAVMASILVLDFGAMGYGLVKLARVVTYGEPHQPSRIAADIVAAGARSMYVFNSDGLLYFLTGIPLPTRYPQPAHLLRDINADMFKFDALTELGRVLDGNQDMIVVDQPLTWRISKERREMLEGKLHDDYCLWRQYPHDGHNVAVYVMKASDLRAASDACQTSQALVVGGKGFAALY